jgi:oligopeptide transport system ATP-binding protein
MYAGRIVETADTRTLFYQPRHPYTRALQRSIPSLQPKGSELYTIRGMPPDLSKPGPGCSFATRCEYATEKCSTTDMQLAEFVQGHAQACLRARLGEI